MLHTAVNAWPMIIPVMVQPDGSNLRPFQIIVGKLVLSAIALLLFGKGAHGHRCASCQELHNTQ